MGYTKSMAVKNLKYIVGEATFSSQSTNYISEVRYMGLSSTQPNADGGNITEPEASSYARALIGAYGGSTDLAGITHFGEPTITDDGLGYKITNHSEIHFNEALEAWGELKYFAIYTSATGGTPIYIGELTSAISPTTNTVPLIRVGMMEITLK